MQKLFAWCKDNILSLITLFLLAFIPLYPKLPLINVIRSWVYIRLEDFLIAFAAGILLIIYIKEKRFFSSVLTIPIFCYWIIGAISLVNALVFIFPHLSGVYPHIALLHYLRRIEYMILFFLSYDAFRKKPFLLPVLWTLIGSYILIILYGYGQKFLGFPAFLTMNEEFAKGVPLRLPPTARFPSTFGGHYDLAAYLVLVIPIMGSLFIGLKKIWQKTAFLILWIFGLIMLLFTASRISFGVYLVAMSAMLVLQKKKILIIPMIIVSLLIMNFTSGVSERFYKTFRVSDVVVDLSTGKPIGTLDSLDQNGAILQRGESPAEENLPKGSEYIGLAGGTDNQVKTVQLYQSRNVPGAVGELATVSGSFLIQKALVYDISITTRFQAEWPMAVQAFERNILLGSGYSTLSVATDGDYHRMLGETGLAGFIAFVGIFAAAFYIFAKRKDMLPVLEQSFVIGVFAGIIGLMINAILIDVFEASKVAYTLWLLLGIVIAMLVSKKVIQIQYFRYLWKLATQKFAYTLYLLLTTWIVWKKTFGLYFMGDDFTWLKWAAQSSINDFAGYFTNSQGFFYRPIPKIWYFMLFSVFWLKPFAYHVMSVALLTGTVLLLYHILMRLGVRRSFAWFGSLLFAVLSIHHENIYWISGQSSLLSGFFLLSAVALIIECRRECKWNVVLYFASYVALMTSMFSYDGMVVAPIIAFLVGWKFFRQNKLALPYLLCIPLYWWMRSSAGALSPSGDYGYKLSTFFINSVSNTAGYTVSMLFGPGIIELWNSIRIQMRTYIKEISVGALFILGIVSALVWKYKNQLFAYKQSCIWFVCYVICFAAYVPLGGMAERYVYIPSIFGIMALTLFAHDLWQRVSGIWMRTVIVSLTAVLLFVNIRGVFAVGNDWEKAGSIVEQTLRVVKSEAFPPKNPKHFYIVNTPIRYGRAWVFPTGLNDALWHIYRESPYTVTPVSSIEEGYRMTFKNGDREVFTFEDYVFKRGIEITK